MSTASATLIAAALWIGCLVPGPWWLVGVAVTLGVAGVVIARTAARAAIAVLAVAAVLSGAGAAGARDALAAHGPLTLLASSGGVVSVEVVPATEARPTALGAWQVVRVERVDGEPTRQRAMVRHDALAEAWPLGARVRARAFAEPLGDDGFDAHIRRLGAVAELVPVGGAEVVQPPGPLLAHTSALRERVRAVAASALGEDEAALLVGLTTGDRTEASVAQREQFAAAGLSHLVVVSGKHTALVLATVLGLAGAVGLGHRGRRVVALAALAWFVVLVRWQPSVLRAGLVASLVLVAGLVGRAHAAPRLLAGAVIVLLLTDPRLAGHLGFVLSVLATAGVVSIGAVVARWARGPRWLRWTVGATVGAQVGVAPVLLATDGEVPLAALPANVVAAPAAAVAQVVGMASALVASVSESAGVLLARAAGPALRLVLWASEAFTALPPVEPRHLASPIAAVLVVAAALARWRRAVAVAVLVVGLAAVAALGARPPVSSEHLRLRVLDVGVGDALLVEAPDGQGGTARLLYDGGPEPDAAVAHLRRLRVRELDVAVLSHGHLDHVAGLPAVLDGVSVGALLVPAAPEPPASDVAAAVHDAARRANVPIVAAGAGDTLDLGQARVRVLSPPRRGLGSDDLNEHSLVLRVDSPDGSLLLTGDAEAAAQRRLLASAGGLVAVDVLQAPHHGADTNADGFLTAVGADTAVVSVGADNPYGHPSQRVVTELQRAGTRVLRTDTDGTVVVTLERGRVHTARRQRSHGRGGEAWRARPRRRSGEPGWRGRSTGWSSAIAGSQAVAQTPDVTTGRGCWRCSDLAVSCGILRQVETFRGCRDGLQLLAVGPRSAVSAATRSARVAAW